jgi:hypothetical protein
LAQKGDFDTMTKKEQLVKSGKRITGRKASADKYIPLYEFLLFDPTYREMKDKAKLLYSFLRKKTLYFEKITEVYEMAIANGEELVGTKSYRDENDEIFCIADNAELAIILQCHYNRVPDFKKELRKYGLLDEVAQLHKSNRLYVLEPEEIADSWNYIEEIKEFRVKIKEENKIKAEKHKAKKQEEKLSKSVELHSNSQTVNDDNEQKESYNDSQKASKNKYKDLKSNLNSLNNNLNLSISEEIENTSLPINLKKLLLNKMDRLIEFQINVLDMEIHFNAVREQFSEQEYTFVLNSLIDQLTEKPVNFAAVMNNWLDRNRKKQNEFTEKKSSAKKPLREELIPEWLNKKDSKQTPQAQQAQEPLTDERKKAIWAKVMKLSNGNTSILES